MIPLIVVGAAAIAALALSKNKGATTNGVINSKTSEDSSIEPLKKIPTSMAEVIEDAKKSSEGSPVLLVKSKLSDLTLGNMIAERAEFPKPFVGTATREELILPKEAIEQKMAEKNQQGAIIPLVKATKKQVSLNDLILEIPVKPSPAKILKSKFVSPLSNVQRTANLFETPGDLHFYRFFKTPKARAFAARLQSIGFGKTIGDNTTDKWNKFFLWLEKVEMPDLGVKLKSYYPYEHPALLINEAESRGLFDDAGFKSLQNFLSQTEKYGSTHSFLKRG